MLQDSSEESIPSYCMIYCDESCIETTMHYEYNASLIFSIAAILVSAYNIYMHLHNFNNPFFQSKIIVILIMAPFYCITSMGSFVFPDIEIYLTLTRDSYEALLLFTFFYLMFSYLAYDRDRNIMEDKKVYTIMIFYQSEVHHFFPFSLCQKPYPLTHWKKAKYFTYRCKKWVMQFLVVKLFATLLMYIVYPNEEKEMHNENYIPKDHSVQQFVSSVISWIVAVSASYSLYYLVLFYHALNKPLAPYSALLKFLTIKITIFFTFWQKIMISIFQDQFLACFNKQAASYNKIQILSSLENTLICFEMFLMAFASGFAYSYINYVSRKLCNRGNLMAVITDTLQSFRDDFRLIRPKRFGFDSSISQSQVPEIQLRDVAPYSRMSVSCSIIVKTKVAESLVDDYL